MGEQAGADKAPALSFPAKGLHPLDPRPKGAPSGHRSVAVTETQQNKQQMHNFLNPRYFIKFLLKCFALGFVIGFVTVWAWHRLRGRHRLGFWKAVRFGLWK